MHLQKHTSFSSSKYKYILIFFIYMIFSSSKYSNNITYFFSIFILNFDCASHWCGVADAIAMRIMQEYGAAMFVSLADIKGNKNNYLLITLIVKIWLIGMIIKNKQTNKKTNKTIQKTKQQ